MDKTFCIIVTYNGKHWIERCISSVISSNKRLNVIVIDNASVDGTTDLIQTNFPEVKIIKLESNIGFGKANNIGIKYALNKDAEYIFLLNQDAWIGQDTINELIAFHKKHKDFGLISPLQYDSSGIKLDKNFSNYISANTIEKIEYSLHNNNCFEETSYVNAASWLISIECLKKVGIFNPIFNHYGEDNDYCNRVIYHGYRIGILYSASIVHDRIYDMNNPFRKYESKIYSAAQSNALNINHTLLINYLKWGFQRTKKIIKLILMLEFRMITSEFIIIYKILSHTQQIRANRVQTTKKGAFI